MVDISAHMATCSGIWRGAPPARGDSLDRLVENAPVPLPASYLALLAITDGGEGDLAVEPGWISLWPSDQVLALNASYAVSEFAPGLFGIGSNGGGELIAFDFSLGDVAPVVSVPFIPMTRELARPLAGSFDALVPLLGVDRGAV